MPSRAQEQAPPASASRRMVLPCPPEVATAISRRGERRRESGKRLGLQKKLYAVRCILFFCSL